MVVAGDSSLSRYSLSFSLLSLHSLGFQAVRREQSLFDSGHSSQQNEFSKSKHTARRSPKDILQTENNDYPLRRYLKMLLLDLATELLLHIFSSCSSIPDVLALASTCRHLHRLAVSSHRLPILYEAAEAEIGQSASF